jgi:hypothetical protein
VVEAVLLASAPEPEAEPVGAPRMTVVLLLALTVMVAVPLPEGMAMVWMPVPTAGMVTAVPTLVSTAGWVGMAESAAGWVGMAVSAAGWPVTTPSELVAVRNDVWGKASMEEVTAAAAEETEESWATAAAAKAATEKKVEERIVDCGGVVEWCLEIKKSECMSSRVEEL